MSLLLDALKKAAELKAKKQSDKKAEVTDDAKTEFLTKSQIDETQPVEKTRLDTQYDHQQDSTQLVEKTQFREQSDDEFDPTEVVEKTRMDTRFESAEDKTEIIEKTSLDAENTREIEGEKTQLLAKPDADDDDEDATVMLTEDDITQFLGSGEGLPVDSSSALSDAEKAENAEKQAAAKRASETAQRIKEAARAKALADEKTQAEEEQRAQAEKAEEKQRAAEAEDEKRATKAEADNKAKAEKQAEAEWLKQAELQQEAADKARAEKERQKQQLTTEPDDTDRGEDTRVTPLNTKSTYTLSVGDVTDKKLPPDPASFNKTKKSAQATQTQSEVVNIETLTNEDTVIRKDTTSTGAFAPDNYDRTLINVAGRDVSQLFAGMKSDANEVMTPDHAKKVFVKNSAIRRVNSYKVYAGIGAFLLLLITVLSLFETQQVFDRVDSDLMPLRRDPMPGLLRAKKPLSDSQTKQENVAEVDDRVLELIRQEAAVIAGDAEPVELEEQDLIQDAANLEAEKARMAKKADDLKKLSQTKTEKTRLAEKTSPKSSLSIESKSSLSKKDVLLQDAYRAYEAGDDAAARKAYTRVLELDSVNRDALLGMAALHLKDNQPAKAIANFQHILLQNPKDTLAMTSLISVANIKPEDSETQLKLLLREQPESPYLYFALGNVYGAQDRWREAQEVYFQALKYKPEDPNYAYNFAISLEHLSQATAAIPFYERALENAESGLATFNQQVVVQRLEKLKQL